MRSVRISLFCVLLAGVASHSAQSADLGVVRASDRTDPTSGGVGYIEGAGTALGVVRTSDRTDPTSGGVGYIRGTGTGLGVVRTSDRVDLRSGGMRHVGNTGTASGVVHIFYQPDPTSGGTGYVAGSDSALGVVRILNQPDPTFGEFDFFEGADVLTFNPPSLFDEEYVIFRRDQGDGRGYDHGYTSLAIFTPIYKSGFDQLVFNNSRLNFTEDGELSASIGVGGRRLIDSINRIIGVSVWFDTDKSDRGNRYEQLGLGLELLGDNWDIRANIYNPMAHRNVDLGTVLGTTPFFRENQIRFRDVRLAEAPLTSADLEFGVRIPNQPGLKVYAGPYWYDSKTRTGKWGARGRIEAYVSDAAMVQISLSDDPLFGTTLQFAVSYAIGAKWQPLRPFRKRTLRERMFEQVARTDRIPNRVFVSERLETPAINPRTGLPYFVAHVNDLNRNGPGDGTFENPFTSLTPAGPTSADIIVVRRGSTSRAAPLVGGTILTSNQRLLGEGLPHTFVADLRGTFLLPEIVERSGQLPFVTAMNGTNVVTLRNDNEVSALNLISPLNGNAIGGTGISGFNINNINNDINLALTAPANNTGAGAGIVLQNVSGIGTIHNVRFNSTQAGSAGGIVVQNQNTGIAPFTLNISDVPFSQGGFAGVQITADNSNVVANLTNVNASQTGDGLLLTARNGGSITAAISQSTFNNSTGSGIVSDVRSGSNISLTANNVFAQGNAKDGVLLVSDTGGAFQAVLTNSVFDGNTRNAIRSVLAGGSTGVLTVTNTTGTGSGEHGISLSVIDGSTLTSTLAGVNVSNSGGLMTAGLADALNIVVMNSQATINLSNVTGINTVGNTTQENGLRQVVSNGGTLTTIVSGSNFSSNQISGISTQVRDAGTTANLTITGTTADGNVVDGFLFDIDAGNFTANVTNSSFNNSGRNAIRGVGGAAPAVTNVTFDSTTANNSGAEGVFFLVNGGGGASVFNFTYLPTAPSAILNSGGANGVNATFTGAGTTGAVNFNGIQIDGGINSTTAGTGVTVSP